jgi:hypothetical protein
MRYKAKSEEEIKEEARLKFREMMFRMSFCERGQSLVTEMLWVLRGRQNQAEHRKSLPDYCYNVFDLFKRTLFQIYPELSEVITITDKELAAKGKGIEDTQQCLKIGWEQLGIVTGIGIRGLRFMEVDVEKQLKQASLLDLDDEQCEDMAKWLYGPDWLEKKSAEIQAQEPGKSVEEIVDGKMKALRDNIKGSIPKWNDFAYQWGPEAMAGLNKGISKGISGLVDERGASVGEGKLQLMDTYVFVLIAWPEIQEMMSANPPKTRNNLWEWLEPFSYANWIEIKDLDQLNRLCDSIKLKLKKPGAPHKVK